MAQPDNLEEFSRFRVARAVARIATDRAYDSSPGAFIPTSGTAIVAQQTEPENADSITYVIVRRGDSPTKAADSLVFPGSIAGPTGETIPDAENGEAAELTDELQAVVDYARSHGLQEVADRLVELDRQPIVDEEVPLQAASAMCFVRYSNARQKPARPLMTVTPAGELDATWKGSEGERIIMRFFPNGSVWVGYKLLKERGSFETTAASLPDPDLSFKIPDWA